MKAVSALMWTTNPSAHAGPQPCCWLSISLPGQRERDRCQLAFVCFKPFPRGQNRAAALSCQTTGFIRRGLQYTGYAEDEEGSTRKALWGRWLSPEKRAALPSQIQACSMLCLSGKEVIYKLTWLTGRATAPRKVHTPFK